MAAESVPWDLLDRADAAAADSAAWHHDLCQQFAGPDLPCSCGGPALLRDVAVFLRALAVDRVVNQAQRAA